jgi:hypothetical protein
MPDPPRSEHAATRIALLPEEIMVRGEKVLAREKAERSEELRRWDQIQLADDATEADAFKRAAVKFGVARYLYRDGVAELVDAPSEAIQTGPREVAAPPPPVRRAITAPPIAPAQASATPTPAKAPVAASTPAPAPSPSPPSAELPKRPVEVKTGYQLFKYSESCTIDPCLKGWIIGHFPKKYGFPAKISNWSQAQVAKALPEIKDHLEQILAGKQKVA